MRVRILQQAHDSRDTGHHGNAKTLEIIKRNFHWPHMRSFVEDWIKSCEPCQRAKSNTHEPYGLLEPLHIPTGPHRSLSMGHIVDPPPSKGFRDILVSCDRLTKMVTFVPTKRKDSAEELAQQFIQQSGEPTAYLPTSSPTEDRPSLPISGSKYSISSRLLPNCRQPSTLRRTDKPNVSIRASSSTSASSANTRSQTGLNTCHLQSSPSTPRTTQLLG